MTSPLTRRPARPRWGSVREDEDVIPMVGRPRARAKIRSGFPLPPKHQVGIHDEFPENMAAMLPDQSFVLPWREGYADFTNAVDQAVRAHAPKGMRWSVRKLKDGSVGVWRKK